MRSQFGSLVRVLELNGDNDTTSVDKESAPAEFLASVQSIQGALAEAHLQDVYGSLCWLGS